jgi:UDP-glucose 4-epimerase
MELGYEVREALRQATPSGGASPRQFIVGDINSGTQWQEALLDIDCVIHLAARVHVMNEILTDPLVEFREVNSAGTVRLAEQAVAASVRRFIYLSTIKVNGEETPLGDPFTDNDKFDSQDAYALSKWEAEKGLFECAERTGMEVVVIRPPLVYGPGVKANFRRLIEWINKGVPLPLGAVHNKRSLVALDNLVDLIVTCIEHSAAADQVFLAGDGEDVSTTELLRHLGLVLGKPARLLPVPQGILEAGLKMLGRGDLAQRLCGSLQVDICKARELLGWVPPISVDEGLKKTANWYQRNE